MAALTLAEHAAEAKDMEPHAATLVKLAAGVQSIVEFGVRTGVSTWALLDGLAWNGKLTSVDNDAIDPPPRVTRDQRWTFISGDDRDPTLHLKLPKASLVFIDTSHEYHHTLEELALAEWLEAKTIVLHDYALDDVHDAVAGFIARRPWKIVGVEPSQWGMAWIGRR